MQKKNQTRHFSGKKNLKPKFKNYNRDKNLSGSRLALLALGIIIILLLLAKTISLVSSLTKPFSADILTKKQYSLDFNSSVNLAFKSKNVWVMQYDPSNQKVTILKIPSDTYMDLPRGFGSWRVGSIYDLGQEENPQIGSELLKESLAKLLGLPMDGFITFNNDYQVDDLNSLILSWHHNPLKMISFLKNIKTDLTPVEAIQLYNKLSSTRPDKVVAMDLEQTDLTKSKLLPDLTRVLGVDTVNLDLFVRQNMADAQISQEGINVAVFNATSHPGLAQDASRIITNLGGNTIILSNTQNSLYQTVITSSNINSVTYKRLAQTFAPQCLKKSCSSSDPNVLNSRAQINILIGEDFYISHYTH